MARNSGKKLTIAIASRNVCLGRGGMERAATNFVRELIRRGHDAFLLGLDTGRPPTFGMDVPFYGLNEDFMLGRRSEIEKLRAFLIARKVDVFVSLQSEFTHFYWAAACMGTGTPFICSERVDPVFMEEFMWNRAGRYAILACADIIHMLVPAYVEKTPARWKNKIDIIPNAAPDFKSRAVPDNTDNPLILYMGRFVDEKRVDILIKAFALLTADFPAWKLVLRGYGKLEDRLKNLIKQLDLCEKAQIVSGSPEVEETYARAQICCLPSRAEGFPNTVLEAMSAGLPIVGIADCLAMASIVRNGENGLLAREATPQSLADALRPLMASPETRKRMGEKSLELCGTLYKREKVFDQWEKLLEETTARKKNTIMDGFVCEPFRSRAELSSACRRDWVLWEPGESMPCSARWLMERALMLWKELFNVLKANFQFKAVRR